MIKLRHGLIVNPQQNRTVIRGELEPETLLGLEVDWYQRGKVSASKIRDLMEGIKKGAENIPDITIGMRGTGYDITNTDVMLNDRVFIIDGLQRWTACIMLLDKGIMPLLGAKVFLPTDINFELMMFRELNSKRTSMAASVLLRNEKEFSRVAGTLWGISRDPAFALANRIAWDQQVERKLGGQLLRGITMLDIVAFLHGHIQSISGFNRGGALKRLYGLEKHIDNVGLQQARTNLIKFFDVVDEVWGIRDAQIKYSETFMTPGWLTTLARVFSDHREFWRENELSVGVSYIRDLKRIRWTDPKLEALARGTSTGLDMLKTSFVEIINKGKSSGRLVDRYTLDRAELAAERKQYYGDSPGAQL